MLSKARVWVSTNNEERKKVLVRLLCMVEDVWRCIWKSVFFVHIKISIHSQTYYSWLNDQEYLLVGLEMIDTVFFSGSLKFQNFSDSFLFSSSMWRQWGIIRSQSHAAHTTPSSLTVNCNNILLLQDIRRYYSQKSDRRQSAITQITQSPVSSHVSSPYSSWLHNLSKRIRASTIAKREQK